MSSVAQTSLQAPERSRVLSTYGGWLAFLAVLAVLYGRVAVALAQEWWVNDDYSHGLLVPFALAYLVYQKRDYIGTLQTQPSWLGLALIAASQVIHLVGFLGAEYFLQRFSMVVCLAGAVLFVFGWKHLWESAFALLLLVLAIPLPKLIFNEISFPLQLIASSWAERSLEWFGIPVLREGNILNLATMTLSVAEACSGIRSLMSLITLSVMVAYFLPFRWWVRSIFIATAIPIAIIANAFRVAGTGVLAHRYGEQAAQGFFHTFSGWLVFVFALSFLLVEVTIFSRLKWGRLPEGERA